MQVEVHLPVDQSSVFRHAQALQQARTFTEVGRVAAQAVQSLTRYRHSWLAIVEPEAPEFVRILQVTGELSEVIFETCPLVPIAGDGMVQEIIERNHVVVVLDGREDPRTNKAIVEVLGNRTIINVPMVLGTQVIGMLGVGTFRDEGVVAPTQGELDALVVFSVQLAAAFERVRSTQRQQRIEHERARLERRLEALQRVEMMGVMASGVAHDLNNLLNIASMNVELLREEPDADAADDALLALRRAAEVCQQLLQLGREVTPPTQPLELDARVDETVRLFKPTLPAGVTITHQTAPHPEVRGDPTQLDQALANLVLNARDAVGEHGTIEIATDEVTFDDGALARHGWARRGRFARVSVIDSGTGIAPELVDRVFDPLVTTKKHGTGLGLAVVARVMEKHRGFVRCESRPGRTRFELYLPASSPPASSPP
jgi:signal transduction histidine kinase